MLPAEPIRALKWLLGLFIGLVLLPGGAFVASAQHLPKAPDSLRAMLRQPALADTVRVKVLQRLCAELNRADVPTAERYGLQALALARRIGFRRGEAMASNSLGATYFYAGNYLKAQQFFAATLPVASRIGLTETVGHAYLGLGNVAASTGDLARAIGYFQQARTAYAACRPPNLNGEMLALNNIAGYLISNERYAEAATPLRQGLALARQLGKGDMEMWMLLNVGRLQRNAGYPDSARATWQLTRRQARVQADSLTEAHALLNEAEMVLQGGDAPQALRLAQQAAVLARQTRARQELAWSLKYTAEALHALRQLAAYDTLKQYQALEDTLIGQDQKERLTELQVKFDVERQQARISNLEQQRRISRLRAEQQDARTRTYGLAAVSLLALLLLGTGLLALLVRSRRRLQASETDLRAANATKDELMRIIGHDLRGPVAGFQQLTPLLHEVVEAPDRAEAHELIRTLDAGAQQLGGLVDNLFQWTRARSNQVVNCPGRLPAALIVASVGGLYEPVAHSKGIGLTYAAPPDLCAWADPDLLTTVLRNLVGNALKFTPAGGTVALRATAVAEGVEFVVSDTGTGLTSAQLAGLFAADRVASTPGLRGEPGTGLGLPLSARFVRLLGGELRAESTPGHGTRFWFRLAVAE